MSCPDEAAIASLFARSLDDEARERIQHHVDGCEDCRLVVASLAATSWGERGGADDADARDPEPGTSVGRYVLIERIGRGGMGVVWAAHDPELDRRVALKLVRADIAGIDGEAQARLQREAQAMARLAHPNVVRVYDIGVVGRRLFVAMELVDGVSLRRALDRASSWRTTLTQLRAAGAGLATAHAAGLVHGDFKPDNVLVDGSGRVCVTDFGLATPIEGQAPLRASHLVLADRDGLTATWSRVIGGTPAYMAPEVWRGEPSSPASDQFSFCVSLYEALFGVKPFAGATGIELLGNIESGSLQPPLRGDDVPRYVRAALQRGLAAVPASRFPSMEALLHTLGRAQRRRTGRIVALSSTLVVATAVAALALVRAKPACPPPTQAALAWSSEEQAVVAQALRATRMPYAEDAWRGVQRHLERFVSRWSQARMAACEATRVSHEQTEAMMSMRLQCLDSQLPRLRATVDVLRAADKDVAMRAIDLASGLPNPASCDDIAVLTTQPRIPGNAIAAIDEARRLVGQAYALHQVGRYRDGHSIADRAVALAERVHYAPLEADAFIVRGELERALARPKDEERSALAALRASEAGRVEPIRARAALLLADAAIGTPGSHSVDDWLDVADAIVARLPHEAALAARAARARAGWLRISRHDEDALRVVKDARRAAERLVAPDDIELALLVELEADIHFERDEIKEARACAERAFAIERQARGPDHPLLSGSQTTLGLIADRENRVDDAAAAWREAAQRGERAGLDEVVGVPLINLGMLLNELGRVDEAEPVLRRALGCFERTSATDSIARNYQARALTGLTDVARQRHRFEEALAVNQRARQLYREVLGDDHPSVADTWCGDGLVLLDGGQARPALQAYQRALAIYDKALGPDHAEQIDALIGIGRAALALGDTKRARAELENSLVLTKRYPDSPSRTAEVEFHLARSFWSDSTMRPRALELANRALAGFAGMTPRNTHEHAETRAWLATHQLRETLSQ